MPLASLTTGIIAAVYMAKDGEVNLERMAAILSALVAAWIGTKRIAHRYWRLAHPDAPEADFPMERLARSFLRSLLPAEYY